MEAETHLLLCGRVGLLNQERLDLILTLTDRISRMQTALRKSLLKRL